MKTFEFGSAKGKHLSEFGLQLRFNQLKENQLVIHDDAVHIILVEDNIYYGLCVHTVNRGKDAKTIDVAALTNADKAMDNVIAAKPEYPEAYLYKARINSVMAKDDVMTEAYQKYLDALTAKGPEEITKNKAKVTEAYNNMASFYANSDKAKAKELLNKTLALDPTNAYATESLKVLK